MRQWPYNMLHFSTPLHKQPVNIKQFALKAVAQHKKKILLSRLACHTQCYACLSGANSLLIHYNKTSAAHYCGLSTTTTSVVSGPSWLSEDRREQRDCQSLIISNASSRYLVPFDSRSGPSTKLNMNTK